MPVKALLHLCLEPWSYRGEQHLGSRASQIKANFFQHPPPYGRNREHVIVIDMLFSKLASSRKRVARIHEVEICPGHHDDAVSLWSCTLTFKNGEEVGFVDNLTDVVCERGEVVQKSLNSS